MRGLSGIGAAIALALAGAAMPISDITTPGAAMFNRRDFSRSRDGTRSNRRYFHKVVNVTTKEPDYMGLEPDHFGLMSITKREFDRPMRRAERKGVPGVPRGFGDKRSICFSR